VLFFGDRARRLATCAAVEALEARRARAAAAAPGPERHGALASCLVAAGELAQGIADAESEAAGHDDGGEAERAAMQVTLELARALWSSFLRGGAVPAPAPDLLAPLASRSLPEAVSVRRAEGYAFYAVYPELYAAAAAQAFGAPASAPTVVGIRSIGTGLGAMVAAGSRARAAPFTVRPGGHPFRRAVRLGASLSAALAAGRDGAFAIADEGPGLSGSSFAAVIEALRGLGAALERIHLFPSHPNQPGPAADSRVRELHGRAPRHHVPFEALFLGAGPLAVGALAEDVIGPADAPPEDLADGRWRRARAGAGRRWPASQGWRERRKFLLRAGGRRWLARFVGLGESGERALARARALASRGLVPPPAALRHGFLFEPWRADAATPALHGESRVALLAAVTAHLRFVASTFPASADEGAAPPALLELVRVNAREALGPESAAAVERLAALAPELSRTARPVGVDGRLQLAEWLALPDGRIEKADALDHHADHALAGCQDALWDVAGAELELGLSADEVEVLSRAVRAAAPGASPACLPFFRAAYAALELGRWTLAAEDGGLDGDERARRRAERDRYRSALHRAVSAVT
jgi:hypothetical protein